MPTTDSVTVSSPAVLATRSGNCFRLSAAQIPVDLQLEVSLLSEPWQPKDYGRTFPEVFYLSVNLDQADVSFLRPERKIFHNCSKPILTRSTAPECDRTISSNLIPITIPLFASRGRTSLADTLLSDFGHGNASECWTSTTATERDQGEIVLFKGIILIKRDIVFLKGIVLLKDGIVLFKGEIVLFKGEIILLKADRGFDSSSNMSSNLSARTASERLTPATINSSPDEHTVIEQSMVHNAPSPYNHEARQTPAPQYMNSEQGTAYSSPGSSHWTQDTFVNEQHPGTYAYAYPNPEFAGDSPYHTYGRGTPASERSDFSVGNPRYREAPQPTRPQNTNKPKPKKKKKGNNNDQPDFFPGDVHILSRDSDGPTQDIERFVNRAIAVRHKEVEGKNGYRPRPMNNFMLYRKAYQERAKEVSSQSNHQIVSQVVARSWKSEAPEVRERYAGYAQTEKDNHILAFPDYQFRPNKSQKAKKRKAGLDTDDENWTDFGDDINDPDWGRSSKRPRTRQNRALTYGDEYEYQGQYGQSAYTLPYHNDPMNTFGASSQARPQLMAAHDPTGDVYSDQIMSQTYSDSLQFDDSQWGSLGMPEGNGVPMVSHVSGLPGAGNALLNPPDDFGPTTQYGDSHLGQLDPLLVTEDHGANGAFTQSEFENLTSMGLEAGWDERRASSSGGLLPAANHNDGSAAAYDDEQFAHFLKS